MKRIVLLTVLFMFMFCGASNALMLDFDDFSFPGKKFEQIVTHEGFTFNNAYVVESDEYDPCGYINGAVSPDNVLLNGYGNDLRMTSTFGLFTFNSAYFTSAWSTDLNVDVTGFSGGTETYNTSFLTNTQTPYLASLDWVGIDSILIHTSGGTDYDPNDGGSGGHLAIDNLVYNETTAAPVPEPATVLLLGAGLSFLGLVQRKRAKA